MRVSRRVGAPAPSTVDWGVAPDIAHDAALPHAFKHDWASGMQWKHQRPKEGM